MKQTIFLVVCLLALATSFLYPTTVMADGPSNSSNPVNESSLLYSRNDSSVPDAWLISDRVSGNTVLNITINCEARNLDYAAELLRNISDPNHSSYGQYLSYSEMNDLVGPNDTTIAQIQDWLNEYSIDFSSVTQYHTAFKFEASASTIETMFNTSIYWYVHNASTERVAVQSGSSTIPSSINSFISGISGFNEFPVISSTYVVRDIQVTPVSSLPPSSTPSENGEHTFTTNTFDHQYYLQTNIPKTLSNLYGLPDFTNYASTSASTNTSAAVIQFPATGSPQNFAPSDLATYSDNLGFATQRSVDNSRIVGTNTAASPGSEGTLDIQAITGINPTANGWFYVMNVGDWILEFTNRFLAQTGTVPQVVSISYGALEYTTTSYASADSNLLLMGLRGVTVIVATGDDGANEGAAFGYSCAQAYATTAKLMTSWPATSPYVLSVGATEMGTSASTTVYYSTDVAPICGESVPSYTTMDVGFYCTQTGVEVAASTSTSGFTSAGGFSRIYAQPSWQANAVSAYVNNTSVAKPTTGYYDTTKRAIPDVAALGSNWFIQYSGTPTVIGGTSLSAPIWATVISLLNNLTLSLNGTTLGFVNPLLYNAFANDSTNFNDVTSGNNICPYHKSCTGCVGYTATTGWDPVTGLGTPNYTKLSNYVTNLIKAQKAASSPAAPGGSSTCTAIYGWRSTSWSNCSLTCYNPSTTNTGTQTRTASCINSCTGATVADSYCPAATKPSTSQTCTSSPLCYATWIINPTGTCSLPCGKGVQQLTLACRQSTTSLTSNINMVYLSSDDFDVCANFTGTTPATTQVCNNFVCPTYSSSSSTGASSSSSPAISSSSSSSPQPTCSYAWTTGTFGSCSMGCYTSIQPANQTRSVSCSSTCTLGSTTTTSTVADSYCSATSKPANYQYCYSGLKNCYADWSTAALTSCTASCGGGTQTQYVGCWQQQGGNGAYSSGYSFASISDNSVCASIQGYTPATTITCNTQKC